MVRGGILLLLLPLALMAQQPRVASPDIKPEVLLLARIKLRMAENLKQLPNYTCLQTIERSVRSGPTKKYKLIDVLRIEVAMVDNKELFAWPGSAKFEEREIKEWAPGGAMGNGAFGLHARSVFLSNVARFEYLGQEQMPDGRTAEKFSYNVPQMLSRYMLRVVEREGIAGYHGMFWADAKTLDLIRLEVNTEHTEIPPNLPIKETQLKMNYHRERIGEHTFLLPETADMSIVDSTNNESRNLTKFNECKQYAGESVLSFDEPPENMPAPKAPPEPVTLDANLRIDAALDDVIEEGKTAIGDRFTATVLSNVKRSGKIVVPKGSKIEGRVLRMERRQDRTMFYMVLLKPERVIVGDRSGDVELELTEVGFPSPSSKYSVPGIGAGFGGYVSKQDIALGRSVFYVREGRLAIQKGLRLVWRTLPPGK